jgi:putative intracellular protease/amidase/YHS domain-containing protein
MDRRELIKYLGTGSLVAGALAGRNLVASQSASLQQSAVSADKKLSPLPVPAGGKLPVAFVIGKEAEVLDFCGPLEVFAGAWTKEGVPLFAPYMVYGSKEPVKVGGGMRVLPDYTYKDAPAPKIIVIPAMSMEDVSQEMCDWIVEASRTTDVTMSVCNGAFVLAKTGLLDGKRCTAHHGGYFRFAGMFPKAKLVRGARFVEEGRLASAGGISSGIDLALRVVERYLGTESVIDLADGMEYQGTGWQNPDSNAVYAKMPEFDEAHPLCPLCLMEGDRSLKTNHKGKNFYFCSPDEKSFFDNHLEVYDRFAAEDAILAAKPKN